MPYDVKLPKWPRLMVRGKNIRPEQADLVILRTTSFAGGLTTGNRKAQGVLRRTFGTTATSSSDEFWDQWDKAATELGALDLQYVWNDHLASHHIDGAHGWVSWGGQVFSRGMGLMSKWPTVGEATGEWRQIAHAFPFLELKAQLVEEQWDENYERVIAHRPLVTWSVGGGAVELHQDPGTPMFPPLEETATEQFDRRFVNGRPRETSVHKRRLRTAVERCRRRTAQGR